MLELLFPSRCAGCGTWGAGALCPVCRDVNLGRAPVQLETIESVWCLDSYRGPLGAALRQAKFRPDRALALQLGALLAERASATLDPGCFDVVIAVPSGWWSRLYRGFAVGPLLARALSSRLALPVQSPLHLRGGPRQSGLSRRARLSRSAGRIVARQTTRGRVLLVDDVITTGSTVEACSRELIGAGATRVTAVSICVTERDPTTTGSRRR